MADAQVGPGWRGIIYCGYKMFGGGAVSDDDREKDRRQTKG